ncbi:hypothetical protein DdX_09118 [Ditylenchus destructor]|uniref:Uncharacterized protein n=1 Tax=Ditylenchus destructor TaxID=166010 RepID=A0AAD4R6L6_9BILA|nr:hypothetical protein DdX_09118 [Ditylenchus destructor]
MVAFGPSGTILSSRSCENDNGNPYASFHFCCATFNTKEHAQLVGVLSFSLFLCLVVISLFLFGSLSIFYITIGVVVYSFLMRALFGLPEKVNVLVYLIFEALQIGFYVAGILYILIVLMLGPSELACTGYNGPNGEVEAKSCWRVKSNDVLVSLFELLLCVMLLTSIKFYFTRVFTTYYKFLAWTEKNNLELRAQYLNGRDVRINIERDIFPSPPPLPLWPNSITRDISYGYGINNANMVFPNLPTYNQAVSTEKTKEDNSNQITTQAVNNPSTATPRETAKQFPESTDVAA